MLIGLGAQKLEANCTKVHNIRFACPPFFGQLIDGFRSVKCEEYHAIVIMGSEEQSDILNILSRIENSSLKTAIETLVNKTITREKNLEFLKQETDQFFLIVVAMLIFFMQCGFAFLEAGSVRSKNTVNILIKNMLDVFIGGVSYWALGWGLAYGAGGNSFCGGSQFFNYQLPYNQYPTWFFQVNMLKV